MGLDIAAYYDRFSETYLNENQSGMSVVGEEIATFLASLPVPSQILDAGCGPGVEGRLAQQCGHEVTGLDISERMLELFRAQVPGGKTLFGSLVEIPSLDHSYDAVICSASLLHLDRSAGVRAIGELFRVTKPNGQVFLLTMVGEGTEETFTHRAARSLGPDGVYFYHWQEADLNSELRNAGFSIDQWSSRELYPNRPRFLVAILRKPLLPLR